MKAKNMTLVGLSILSIVFLMTLISAAALELTLVDAPEAVLAGSSVTITFNLSSPDATIDYTELNWSGSSTNIGEWSALPNLTSIIMGDSVELTAILEVPSDATETINAIIDLQSETAAEAQLELTIEVTEPTPEPSTFMFCEDGAVDYSDLTLNVDIQNNGEGDDDEWLPLDTIEVEVELQNDKEENMDLDNVIFELGLFKEGSSSNIMDEMMWISSDDELVDVGDIDAEEEETFTFEFRVDPQEVEDGTYKLYVKAYPDNDEDVTCIDYSDDLAESQFGDSEFYAEIQVNQENDKDKMVVIDEESISSPIPASCGQNVIFSADIYNIGDTDFEDKTKVVLYNTELGLNVEEVVLGDMDAGDNSQISFAFQVPKNAEEKQYPLSMQIYYDYDEDDDNYDRSSDETFNAYLRVEGNCAATIIPVSVEATLESGGLAGEDLVVKAIVTNNGNTAQDFIINAAGYTTWASTSSLSESVFTLAAGQSKEVIFTFAVNEDAEGTNYFNIEVLSEGQLALNQAVSVLIENTSSEGLFAGLTGSAIGGSSYLWGIGLLNLVLIVIIIILAVRVSRR